MRIVFALLVLAGCDYSLDHTVTVELELDDPCLTCFPECVDSGYGCFDSDGSSCEGCRVACVAARELVCDPDGPRCKQSFGDDEVDTPVFCMGGE